MAKAKEVTAKELAKREKELIKQYGKKKVVAGDVTILSKIL